MIPYPLAGAAEKLLDALRLRLPGTAIAALDAGQLMAERALLRGLRQAPGISAGGSCHLFAAGDVHLALNLPRDDDWALIPAWLEAGETLEPGNWQAVANRVRRRRAEDLVERAHMLGLAAAVTGRQRTPRHVFVPGAEAHVTPSAFSPMVVDLSALWAGPLASHLLWLAGAEVIKVESLSRPDGARQGNADFYNLLNQGKRSIALDFNSDSGTAALRALVSQADIVIESSRPRALYQLGIDAHAICAANPGLTWVSITGFGREEPAAQWIAYGDDAGVAAGLSDLLWQASGEWGFLGDAIADPLTGIDVALAAAAGWRRGGAGLVSIALSDVVAWALEECMSQQGRASLIADVQHWWQQRNSPDNWAARRPVRDRVASLGAHTAEILAETGPGC